MMTTVASFGAKPGFVTIQAFLRAKSLECPAMPHHAELAVAIRAMILHGILLAWHRSEITRSASR